VTQNGQRKGQRLSPSGRVILETVSNATVLPIIAILPQTALAQTFAGLISQAAEVEWLNKNFFPLLGERGKFSDFKCNNRALKLPPRGKKSGYAAARGAGNNDILLPSL